jgi:GNAT superfamily N-acetyltransferase
MLIRSLGYRTDVMVRRLSGSVVEERSDFTVVRTPAHPEFWWGNFLLMPGAPAAADAARWMRWFAAEFPDADHRAFGPDTTDGDAGDPAALTALGAHASVNAVLSATALREPDAPDLELRAFDDDDWAQLVTLRLAVYPPPDSPSPRAGGESELVRGQVTTSEQLVAAGHGRWLGAFDDGLLVSALGIVSDGSGVARYQAVETHPDYRRRGLARRLLYDAAAQASDLFGARELVIVADPFDHAVTLYQSLGLASVELQVEIVHAPTLDA